jgi:hypothetical protein
MALATPVTSRIPNERASIATVQGIRDTEPNGHSPTGVAIRRNANATTIGGLGSDLSWPSAGSDYRTDDSAQERNTSEEAADQDDDDRKAAKHDVHALPHRHSRRARDIPATSGCPEKLITVDDQLAAAVHLDRDARHPHPLVEAIVNRGVIVRE